MPFAVDKLEHGTGGPSAVHSRARVGSTFVVRNSGRNIDVPMLALLFQYTPARNRTWTDSSGGCCAIRYATGACCVSRHAQRDTQRHQWYVIMESLSTILAGRVDSKGGRCGSAAADRPQSRGGGIQDPTGYFLWCREPFPDTVFRVEAVRKGFLTARDRRGS